MIQIQRSWIDPGALITRAFKPAFFIKTKDSQTNGMKVETIKSISAWNKVDEGGEGGGGPEPKETSAGIKVSVPWLPNLATPIISDKQDSSVVSEIDIPSKDVGQGIGTGECSGIGTGSGTGIGGGFGNGIGDGIGDGSGAAIIPPRPLLLRISEYPASESKKQTSVTIQLSIRVNAIW